MMKSNWIFSGEPVYKSFEGRTLRVPTDYDSFLTQIYGKDYMTPVVWENKGEHFHAKQEK